MPAYQHYSFDLWLTLIRSNPLFKKERAKFFCVNFNERGKSLEAIELIFRQVDIMVNTINEKTGKNIDADEMYLMVISMMHDFDTPASPVDLEKLYQDMESLLFSYLPVVYCAETPVVLSRLKESGNPTISILSNTGFIGGKTLRKILRQIGLEEFFTFQIYSDEAGMSKPNNQLFKLMIRTIYENNKGKDIAMNKIIHIGDNPVADIDGACAAGIQSLLVNSNDIRIASLLN